MMQFRLGRRGVGWWPERRRAGRQRGPQAAGVELGCRQVACQPAELGGADRRIELDQDVAGAYTLAVAHVDGANDAGFQRLHQLGAPARDDLPPGATAGR